MSARMIMLISLLMLTGTAKSDVASKWSTGAKKLLLMRIDFVDNPGEPASAERIEGEMKKSADFLKQNSYDKFHLSWQVTGTLRMPKPYSEYETARLTGKLLKQLSSDARAAATRAGHRPNEFDLDAVIYRPQGKDRSGGHALHRRRGLLLAVRGGLIDGRTIVHEIGHNLNLFHDHGSAWETKDGSIIGAGKRIDRGNPFDRMGNGYFWEAHYNSRAKYSLQWLDEPSVQRVLKSGTYFIQAHDDPTSSGVRALEIEIPGDSTKKYWVEFRQRFPLNDWASNGALIYWSYPSGTTDLLDMSPGSKRAMRDAALTVGRTFSDTNRNLHITLLRRLNTTPAALEVRVEIAPKDNRVPQLALRTQGSRFRRGAKITVEAMASDPDDDPLCYYWEFSDGIFSTTNLPSVSRSYERPGSYSVNCWASDSKGGVAMKTFRFTVVP